MSTEVILSKCIEQAEQIKHMLQNNGSAQPGCLGGEMLPAYKEVREQQIAIINRLLIHLNG